ncbi:MAG: copper chaperone PCu(A)C [Rhodococcus sp.]|nr:copper chaperone PCu(A)C [Rhodococcus sp. (in: high G+C Gram-positive bacteria)]
MTALDKPTRRVATAIALAVGAALTLSACSAGQITQTSHQAAAINGNNANSGHIALRNVHVVYPNAEEYSIEPGGTAILAFTIVNQSNEDDDRLISISSDYAGSVTITEEAGSLTIPAQGALAAAQSEGEELADLVDAAEEAQTGTTEESPVPVDVLVVKLENLNEGVRPGLTFPVTFTFEKAGDVTIEVPVDAGPVLERDISDKSPIKGEGGH